MNLPNPVQARVDRYLAQLRRALVDVPVGEREELVREIESHLVDAYAESSSGVESSPTARIEEAIDRLGDPSTYAEALASEHRLRRATTGFRPASLLGSLLGRVGQGLGQAVGGLLFAFGYIALLVVAIATTVKPFVPESGLWIHPGGGWSLSMIEQPGATEVLGWWIIPIGVTVVVAGWTLLNRALRLLLRMEARRRKH